VPPATVHREWSPFVERVQRDTGTKIELKVFATFSEFEHYIFAGKADLVFINPYQAVELKKAMGYIPLVRDGSRKLNGVLVVRADGPIKKISDLEGQDIAFPHPNAFGASLHMRATLREVANINFNPVYVTTHANVYRHVLLGKVAAGGGVNVTLNKEPEHLRSQLRVVFQTDGVAPHPLAAHPRVPEEVREKITRSVIGMAAEIQGRALLQSTTIEQPVRANYALDYAGLEKLRLDKYYVHSDAPEQ
jgi:phosphonate transport system substrate-binding protein